MPKTGLVMIYVLMVHAARTFDKYSAKAMAAIDASSLSTTDKATAKQFLNDMSQVALLLRLVTGY